MFFNKAKKTGCQLAAYALDLANSNEAKQFVSYFGLKPEEALRFHWGVGIVNMVAAIWNVNVAAGNPDTAKSILEPMQQAYSDAIDVTGTTKVRIGDFIPHEEEKRFLRLKMMLSLQGEPIDNIDEITTDIRTLTDMIYDRRVGQYYEDLRIGFKEAMALPETSLGPMFHVARRFAVHLTGTEDDSSMVVRLSLLFSTFLTCLLDPCQGILARPSDRSIGTLTFPDGRKYVGEYKDGKPHGQGTLTLPDGGTCVGEFKDDKLHGQGTLTFSDGRKCVGEFKDGKLHGQGTFTWPDGQKYVGEFKASKYHGQGTLTYPDGHTYVGEFKDGQYHGQGTHTYPDGRKYVGEFKDSTYHGQGIMYRADGSVLASGTWENNAFVRGR